MPHHRKRRYHEIGSSEDRGRFGVGEMVTALKKPRQSELVTSSDHPSHRSIDKQRRENHRSSVDPSNDWQVVKSKSSRTKGRKQESQTETPAGPGLRFHSKITTPVLVKDLQDLVLYILADGVAPTWVGVQNSRMIEQVVVIMVPGLDEVILQAVVSSTAGKHGNAEVREIDQTARNDASPYHSRSADGTECTEDQMLQPSGRLADSIIPVKAPGDSKYAKVHSPLQAMLIAPTLNSKGQKAAKVPEEKSFQPSPTSIIRFIHTADELREAEYPVHPALFASQIDGDLEKKRREAAGQSEPAGWVNTNVAVPTPTLPDLSHQERRRMTQGLDVYAVDCEMVLTTDDSYSLARVSVLDWDGRVILDKFVKPSLPVKNYFTQFSGITPQLLENVTTTMADIQQELLSILTPSTIVLGHSLESDLNALKLTHPFIIDTSMIYPHPRGLPLRSSLKFLANRYLKREIQMGGDNGHDSVEDARAVLDLVRQKCEKGPKWGTTEANGESIFRRLARAGRISAIVEYGTPERGFGRDATRAIGCQNDDEIVDGVIQAVHGGESEAVSSKANFTWGRLRDMETALGWNSNTDRSGHTAKAATQDALKPPSHAGDETTQSISPTTEDTHITETTTTDTPQEAGNPISKAKTQTIARLSQIYQSLRPGTLLIVYSGTGDMRPVLHLQQMQQQYRREFKVKKWDELSVKWTDVEEQALRHAVEEARLGCGLVCVTR